MTKPRHDPRWTLAACVLASSLSFVEGSVLNVALPAIRASYGAGAAQVQWVVNAYLLPLSALLLLGGALGDHYGRRLLLLIGTSLFAAASLACALAPSLNLLLAARALQGVGAALLLPNSLALLNAAFQGEERGRAVGIWAAAGAASAAIAPLIGGWLVDNVGWPSIFYINLPLAAGAMLLAVLFVGESRDKAAARTDYPGAALATFGLLGTTFGLTRWSSSASLDPVAIATIFGGLVMLALFLWFEARRGEAAMMPLSMFGDRCFSGLNLLTFLLYGAFGVAMLLIPYVLISAGGYSPVLNDAFNLADWTGAFSGVPSFDFSNAALSPGLTWDTSTFVSDGRLVVVAVPEPAAALLGGCGLMVLFRRRRADASVAVA